MLNCMWLADKGILIKLQAGILTCMFLLELLQMQVKYTNELGLYDLIDCTLQTQQAN